jgi:hypothetical protein
MTTHREKDSSFLEDPQALLSGLISEVSPALNTGIRFIYTIYGSAFISIHREDQRNGARFNIFTRR